MTFEEYLTHSQQIAEGEAILEKLKDIKDESFDIKNQMFGSLCLAIGRELANGSKTLKKDQIEKIIELLESIKKDIR